VGNNEEFDRNSICIGNIDGTHPPENKIAVGKHVLKTSTCRELSGVPQSVQTVDQSL